MLQPKVGFMDLQPHSSTCPQKKAEECGFCGPSFQLQGKRKRKKAHKILNVRSKKVRKVQGVENLFFRLTKPGVGRPVFSGVRNHPNRLFNMEQGGFPENGEILGTV